MEDGADANLPPELKDPDKYGRRSAVRRARYVSIESLFLYVLMAGVLTKQGSGFPWSWQERIFVLKGSGLFYFKATPPAVESDCLSLAAACAVLVEPS